MSRVRVAALALVVTCAAGWLHGADQTDKKAPPRKVILPAYFKKLGLTDKQVQDIGKVQDDYKAKTQALRRQLQELREKEKAATEKVLTPAQLKRLRFL